MVLLLLPLLLSGYVFATTWYGAKYKAARENGYRLYFRVVLYGIGLFALSVAFTMHCNFLGFISVPVLQYLSIEESKPVYLNASSLALSLGWLAGHVLNFFPGGKKYWLQKAIEQDEFEKLIIKSMEEAMLIAITMSNRNVYVGYVLQSFDPALRSESIRILPLRSGYRDKDTLRVEFTANYYETYQQLIEHPSKEGTTIDLVIRRFCNGPTS